MGKTLNIKNSEIYDAVAKLAALTGLSMTQAVKQAVILELEALKQRKLAQQKAAGSISDDGALGDVLAIRN